MNLRTQLLGILDKNPTTNVLESLAVIFQEREKQARGRNYNDLARAHRLTQQALSAAAKRYEKDLR